MKKYLLILCLAVSFVANGQYKSFFGDSSTVWYNQYYAGFYISLTNITYLAGDTIIDSLEYKQVFYKYRKSNYFDGIYDTLQVGFMRQDSLHEKLWFRYNTAFKNDTIEYLMVDLSLQKGDSFLIFLEDYYKVEDVYYGYDSLKTIRLSRGISEYAYFIEAVGGYLEQYFGNSIYFGFGINEQSFDFLVCKYNDDLLVNRDSVSNITQLSGCEKINDCEFFCAGGSVGENQNTLQVQVFPNPSAGEVNLVIDKAIKDEFSVSVYDAQMRLVQQYKTYQNTLKLNLPKSGMYFLRVTNHQKLSFSGKILVE